MAYDVIYICDRKKECNKSEFCGYPLCTHTKDVNHALYGAATEEELQNSERWLEEISELTGEVVDYWEKDEYYNTVDELLEERRDE